MKSIRFVDITNVPVVSEGQSEMGGFGGGRQNIFFHALY